ncbi:MAG: M64 family metallopeptidase [Phycisphaerales bacterium]
MKTAVIALVGMAGLAGAALAHGPDDERVHVCWPGEDGVFTGTVLRMPLEPGVMEMQRRARQPGDNRVDIVFVGDGYTADEQDQFHADVAFTAQRLFEFEPYIAYEPYFRVHAVEVISNESGVDNDPVDGIEKDTALDMRYWCLGVQRGLCVSVYKAYLHAELAPAVDQVIALANSATYGGAGYGTSNLATCAGQNFQSPDVILHELGHSLGELADEYTTGGPTTWTDPEPPRPNASIFEAEDMAAMQVKWYRWLGYRDPRFNSTVGTIEGSYLSQYGIYRPSNRSMMRESGKKMNAPGAEQVIFRIYDHVDPVDAHTPNGAPVAPDAVLSVTPMQPVGHALSVSWDVDGVAVSPGGEAATLSLAGLGVGRGATVTATVVDPTDMVRDEAVRAELLTQRVSWVVGGCPGDFDLSGTVNLDDVDAFVAAFLAGDAAADVDASGTLNVDDIDVFVASFVAGCP